MHRGVTAIVDPDALCVLLEEGERECTCRVDVCCEFSSSLDSFPYQLSN